MQEIIKVIRLKLFLDIVPSSLANITSALRGCFLGGSVYVSFRFVLKQSKTSNSLEMSSLIFWLQARELRPSVCCNTFRNFNGSLNKRRVYPSTRLKHGVIAPRFSSKYVQNSISLLFQHLIIVNTGDWLGSPANIKGTNKDAKIYVGRSITLHNLLFLCSYTLQDLRNQQVSIG